MPIGVTASTAANPHADRIRRLEDVLAVCPTEILARCELATLQEELSRPGDALLNWKTVLNCDPNNLQAREGVARCQRNQAVSGTPLCDSSPKTATNELAISEGRVDEPDRRQ
jgi:cytochrome c-type biogenesis protein CcmH/NrfG